MTAWRPRHCAVACLIVASAAVTRAQAVSSSPAPPPPTPTPSGPPVDQNHVLFATNAIAIDECTLHILNATSGQELKSIGTVRSDTDDEKPMGIFGMCDLDGVMYGINHLDQLVTIDLLTAKATLVGSVGVNGLYDLACAGLSFRTGFKLPRLYSYGAQDSRIVSIDHITGQGKLLATEIPRADAVSMDFGSYNLLWMLMNGKELSVVNLTTGALTGRDVLPGMHVTQRHGSIRDGILYSAYFEADPSSMWQVNLGAAAVQEVLSTDLSNTYTLAFVLVSLI